MRREEEAGIRKRRGGSEKAEDLQTDDHDEWHTAEPKDDAFHDRGLREVSRPLHWPRARPVLAGEGKSCAWASAYKLAGANARAPSVTVFVIAAMLLTLPLTTAPFAALRTAFFPTLGATLFPTRARLVVDGRGG